MAIKKNIDKFSNSLPISEFVNISIHQALIGLNTIIPCSVNSYNLKKNYISCQPLFNMVGKNGKESKTPIITEVPVMHFGGSDFKIKYKPKKDDVGVLIVAQRSIDKLKSDLDSGSRHTPAKPRRKKTHNIGDAFFIPCNFESNSKNKIEWSGSIQMKNEITDLNTVISSLIDSVDSLSTNMLTLQQSTLAGFTALALFTAGSVPAFLVGSTPVIASLGLVKARLIAQRLSLNSLLTKSTSISSLLG